MKNLVVVALLLISVPSFGQKYDSRIANPFVFCSAPKPCAVCEPFRSIYENICSSGSTKAKTATYGRCGAAVNTCVTGQLVDVADNPMLDVWVCQGYDEDSRPHGNYSETCSAPTKLHPVNDPTWGKQPVEKPLTVQAVATESQHLAAPAPVASPVYGVCATKVNTCVTGKVVDVADTPQLEVWVCQGFNAQGQPNGNYSESCGIPTKLHPAYGK